MRINFTQVFLELEVQMFTNVAENCDLREHLSYLDNNLCKLVI